MSLQNPYNCSFDKYLELNDSPDSPYYKKENRLYVSTKEYGTVEVDTLRRIEREIERAKWEREEKERERKYFKEYNYIHSLLSEKDKESIKQEKADRDRAWRTWRHTPDGLWAEMISLPHNNYDKGYLYRLMDYMIRKLSTEQAAQFEGESKRVGNWPDAIERKLYWLIKTINESGSDYNWESMYEEFENRSIRKQTEIERLSKIDAAGSHSKPTHKYKSGDQVRFKFLGKTDTTTIVSQHHNGTEYLEYLIRAGRYICESWIIGLEQDLITAPEPPPLIDRVTGGGPEKRPPGPELKDLIHHDPDLIPLPKTHKWGVGESLSFILFTTALSMYGYYLNLNLPFYNLALEIIKKIYE